MKQGKREYLNNKQTKDVIKKLEFCFKKTVNVPRIKVGKRQSVETLINEEALMLAKYLRNEKNQWNLRITTSP